MLRTTLFLILLSTVLSLRLPAQVLDSSSVAGVVFLDSITVTAVRSGWDLDAFIERVKNDQSLYGAFRNLRGMSYGFDYEVTAQGRKGKKLATASGKAIQQWDGHCRTMHNQEEHITGPWLEPSGEYTHFSASMFDRLFLTHGRVCAGQNTSPARSVESNHGREKYINLLKRILFNPGSGEDIPFLGHEFELFDVKKSTIYQHSISQIDYHGAPVFVVRSILSENINPREKKKNIIRELVSYLRVDDGQVIHRAYHLVNHSLILDCDVNISFTVAQHQTKYFVQSCYLDGYWNFPGKKWEKASFNIQIKPQP